MSDGSLSQDEINALLKGDAMPKVVHSRGLGQGEIDQLLESIRSPEEKGRAGVDFLGGVMATFLGELSPAVGCDFVGFGRIEARGGGLCLLGGGEFWCCELRPAGGLILLGVGGTAAAGVDRAVAVKALKAAVEARLGEALPPGAPGAWRKLAIGEALAVDWALGLKERAWAGAGREFGYAVLVDEALRGALDEAATKGDRAGALPGPYCVGRPEPFTGAMVGAFSDASRRWAELAQARLVLRLGTPVSIGLVSTDSLLHVEFARSIPCPTFIAVVGTGKGRLILEIDPQPGFDCLEALLGRRGDFSKTYRIPTAVESTLMEELFRELVALLGPAWSGIAEFAPVLLALETSMGKARIAADHEPVILATFRVAIGGMEGMMNLCIPFPTFERLLGIDALARAFPPRATAAPAAEARDPRFSCRASFALSVAGLSARGCSKESLEALRLPPGARGLVERRYRDLRARDAVLPPPRGPGAIPGSEEAARRSRALLPHFPLPLTLAFDLEEEVATASEKAPLLGDFAGRTGSLCLGGEEIARVELREGDGALLPAVSGEADVREIELALGGIEVEVAVVVARTEVEAELAEDILRGGVSEFDTGVPTDAPLELLVLAPPCLIGTGDALAVDGVFHFRLRSAASPEGWTIRAAPRFVRGKKIPVALELGRVRVRVAELLGLGEGDILPLGASVHGRARLRIGDEGSVEAEIAVLDERYAARMPQPYDPAAEHAPTQAAAPEPGSGQAFLDAADPFLLARLLVAESPQTIAFVLARLDARKRGRLVDLLPPDLKGGAIERLATLGPCTERTLDLVGSALAAGAAVLGAGGMLEPGGVAAAAETLAWSGAASEREALESIQGSSPGLYRDIRRDLLAFDDLLRLDERAMQRVLREIDLSGLRFALDGVGDELREKFFRNMSHNNANRIKEDMSVIGQVEKGFADGYRERIMAIVQHLVETGEIYMKRRGEGE